MYGRYGRKRFGRYRRRGALRRRSRAGYSSKRRMARRTTSRRRVSRFRRAINKVTPPRLNWLRTANFAPYTRIVDMEYRGIWDVDQPTQLGIGANNMDGLAFKVNSIWDPNNGGIGTDFNHSCHLYGLLTQFYGRYFVISTKAVFTLRQNQDIPPETVVHPVKWGVILDEDASSIIGSTWLSLLARPTTKMKEYMPSTEVTGHKQSITMYWDHRSLPDSYHSNISTIGADPSDISYWMPWFAFAESGIAGGTGPNFVLEVTIRYRVRLSDPRDINDQNTLKIEQDAV